MRHTLNEYHPGEYTPRDIAAALGRDSIDAGLVGQIVGALAAYSLRNVYVPAFWLCCGLFALGSIVLIVGCYRHATYLGYRPYVAALGLLSLVGVAVLYCLPDRLNRGRGPRGFDIVMPRKVSTLWVDQDSAAPQEPAPQKSPPRAPWRL